MGDVNCRLSAPLEVICLSKDDFFSIHETTGDT